MREVPKMPNAVPLKCNEKGNTQTEIGMTKQFKVNLRFVDFRSNVYVVRYCRAF